MNLFQRLFGSRLGPALPEKQGAPSSAAPSANLAKAAVGPTELVRTFHEDAYLWGYNDPPKDGDILIPMLDSEKADVRVAAARALGKLGDGRAINQLIRLLGDTDHSINGHYVRREAAAALARLGEPQWLPLIEGSAYGFDTHESDFARLSTCEDPRATEPLIYALTQGPLSDGSYSCQIAAAMALGMRGDKRAIPAIQAALVAATFDVFRRVLIEALRLLESSESCAGNKTQSSSDAGSQLAEAINCLLYAPWRPPVSPKAEPSEEKTPNLEAGSGHGRVGAEPAQS
jgi:HEAT repeat protein